MRFQENCCKEDSVDSPPLLVANTSTSKQKAADESNGDSGSDAEKQSQSLLSPSPIETPAPSCENRDVPKTGESGSCISVSNSVCAISRTIIAEWMMDTVCLLNTGIAHRKCVNSAIAHLLLKGWTMSVR